MPCIIKTIHFFKKLNYLEELSNTVSAQDVSLLLLNKLQASYKCFNTSFSPLTLIDVIVSHMSLFHPVCEDYMNTPRSVFPHKNCSS
jgi:hypothetical protein